jgi:disulfide bond formation protein DsbB
MKKITYKQGQFFLIICSFFLLFMSFYFEYIKGFQPCPLCIMQRVCILFILLFLLIEFYLPKKNRFIIGLLILFSLAGLYFSSRQLWLQALPAEEAPACLPSLDVLIHYFPWQDTVNALFWGAGDCAEVSWRFLGLSMPAWTALYFIFMFFGIFFFGRRKPKV